MAKSELEIQINAKDGASSVFRNIGTNLQNFSSQVNKIALGMAAVGGAIVGMGIMAVKTYAKMGSEIYDLSKKTGMGTEALSEFRYMAEQCGTSLGFMEMAARRMSSLLYDAASGSAAATNSLAALNLTVGQLQGLAPEDQFWIIANALAGVEDQSMQSALAVDIFGRSGTDLLPILAEGTEGIQAMKDEAAALGIVFDEEAAAKADKLDDSLNKIKQSFTGVFIAISEALLPILIPLAEKFVEIVKGIRDWVAEHPAAVKAILAIGVALLVTAAALKAYTVGLALAQALTPGVGWATLAAGLALAAGAYIAINEMMGGLEAGGGGNRNDYVSTNWGMIPREEYKKYYNEETATFTPPENYSPPSYQHGGIVPGPIGQPVPIIAHGGEQFAGVGNSIGGEINIYNYGSVVTMRELEDEMREAFLRIKDRNTSTGF